MFSPLCTPVIPNTVRRMRVVRDLTIALFAGFVVALVLVNTGEKHLGTALWVGTVTTAVVLVLILVIERKQWHIRVVASAIGSYFPSVHLSRPKRYLRDRKRSKLTDQQLVKLGRLAERADPTEPAASELPAAPAKASPVEPEIPTDEAASLMAEGHELQNELLVARRKPSTPNPLGGSAAVNAVAAKIKNWNRRVAEAVDHSDLSFSTKMALEIYNDPMFSGASPKRLAEVLEDNLGMLSRLSISNK
jgi:hypothetical protein